MKGGEVTVVSLCDPSSSIVSAPMTPEGIILETGVSSPAMENQGKVKKNGDFDF